MFINFDITAGQPDGTAYSLVQEENRIFTADAAGKAHAEEPEPNPDKGITTMAIGEEGGGPLKPDPKREEDVPSHPLPITTMAIGEEGGIPTKH
jgi:hypothetical protein